MRLLVIVLGIVAVSAQAQSSGIGYELPPLVEESSDGLVGALQGGAILLGGAATGIATAALVVATVNSGPVLLVTYPIATATGAYLTGRLVKADGIYLGALIGSVVGAVPGTILLLMPNNGPSDDDGLTELLTELSVFFGIPPLGAAIGYHVMPSLLSDANSDVVPGLSMQFRF